MSEQETQPLTVDGFDEAFIGYAERFGQTPYRLAVYDTNKIISILMTQNMSKEDAWEYFTYNIIGAWVGEGTPIFMTPCNLEEFKEQLDSDNC